MPRDTPSYQTLFGEEFSRLASTPNVDMDLDPQLLIDMCRDPRCLISDAPLTKFKQASKKLDKYKYLVDHLSEAAIEKGEDDYMVPTAEVPRRVRLELNKKYTRELYPTLLQRMRALHDLGKPIPNRPNHYHFERSPALKLFSEIDDIASKICTELFTILEAVTIRQVPYSNLPKCAQDEINGKVDSSEASDELSFFPWFLILEHVFDTNQKLTQLFIDCAPYLQDAQVGTRFEWRDLAPNAVWFKSIDSARKVIELRKDFIGLPDYYVYVAEWRDRLYKYDELLDEYRLQLLGSRNHTERPDPSLAPAPVMQSIAAIVRLFQLFAENVCLVKNGRDGLLLRRMSTSHLEGLLRFFGNRGTVMQIHVHLEEFVSMGIWSPEKLLDDEEVPNPGRDLLRFLDARVQGALQLLIGYYKKLATHPETHHEVQRALGYCHAWTDAYNDSVKNYLDVYKRQFASAFDEIPELQKPKYWGNPIQCEEK